MEFIKEWITNIILFVLLATVMDMLLPNSNLQKYTKMVMGLLLIAIILSPILKLVSADFETAISSVQLFSDQKEKNQENLLELKKKEIQASQRAYILEQMAVQLKKDVEEELMDQHGLVISKIDLLVDEQNLQAFPENLQKIKVQLAHSNEEAEAVAAIEKVEINTEQPLRAEEQPEDSKRVASLLSEKWDVQEQSIEVVIEGGNT